MNIINTKIMNNCKSNVVLCCVTCYQQIKTWTYSIALVNTICAFMPANRRFYWKVFQNQLIEKKKLIRNDCSLTLIFFILPITTSRKWSKLCKNITFQTKSSFWWILEANILWANILIWYIEQNFQKKEIIIQTFHWYIRSK